jgi:ATP-binding cassette subfamily B protein/subfamily B ATP-binding cassette protein MsbA
MILGGLLALVATVIAMLVQNMLLAVASFAVIPVMVLATNYFSKLAREAYRKTRRTIGDVSADLQEELAGAKVAQAFNRVETNLRKFEERNAQNRSANMAATLITSAFTPLVDFLAMVATAIVAGFGGWLVTRESLTVGSVVAFLAYVQTMFRPLQQLSTIYTQGQSSLAGAERIFDLVDGPNEETEDANLAELPPIKGDIEFRGVSFAYDPAKPVLSNVSFTAPAGQTVAIVGPTGAGKTTIINLLARYYEPVSGSILVDGHDVAQHTRASLRRQMAAVPQDNFLFAGTLRENILYGRLDASDADLRVAMDISNADTFIDRLKNGLDTVLGERGGGLSQGQRQLVGIARAVLANPRILILDEATSSVDTYTESLIQKALGALLANRTSIVIAHRLSTIRDAHLVLVVKDGRIVERGQHDELLALNGVYAELYRRQFRGGVT